ncbi:MAG: acetate--CoA ligase family protein [Desulfobacterales bacterium]|nr:MAG: acetate--CoA ligase family protein [Desulfobacterales bacterium]
MYSVQNIIEQALAAGQKTLSEYHSKLILAEYGVPVAKEFLVKDYAEAQAAAKQIGYPVVLKVCASEAAHKTEQGLITLGITNAAQLKRAFTRLITKAQALGGGLLIQEMVHGARELVTGMTRDSQFGPCVMFGLGGIFTEALEDVSFRVAPLSEKDALQMCTEIRGHKILSGIRGLKPVNMEIISHCLQQLGQIGLDHPAVREIDINPLIVRDGCPLAVDALIVLDKPQPQLKESTAVTGGAGLEKFFQPNSVAVLGASQTPHKAGNDVIKNILANDFGGDLYFVNPKGGEIFGREVHPSIHDLPDGIDLAIIILPAAVTPQAIRECASKGIKAVVLAAGGFAEVDETGKKLQEETLKAIRDSGVRAIGPNTSGHISTPHNFTSSFFPLGKIPRGNISYIAQTGNFATHTMRYIMSGEHYGVSRVLGLGNKLDVEESEVLEYYAQDPETKAILIYLESFKRPRRFIKVARQVTRSKPVILLKGGATTEGAHAAAAHTAALASNDRIIDGALRQAGVVRAYKYSHLFLAAKALASMPLPKGNRVSLIAPSGAMLVCLADLCNQRLNINIPSLEEQTRQHLQDISAPYIRMRNPVDIWPSAVVYGVEYAYREGMEAVLNDNNIDAVVSILMLTDETGVPPLNFILELKERHPHKPIYITFTGEKKHMDAAKAYLEPKGVPTFNFIEEPFEVLDILVQCRYCMEES